MNCILKRKENGETLQRTWCQEPGRSLRHRSRGRVKINLCFGHIAVSGAAPGDIMGTTSLSPGLERHWEYWGKAWCFLEE